MDDKKNGFVDVPVPQPFQLLGETYRSLIIALGDACNAKGVLARDIEELATLVRDVAALRQRTEKLYYTKAAVTCSPEQSTAPTRSPVPAGHAG